MEIRNIAIIAHVDHGKTTLTDAILRQTGAAEEGVTMDSNTLEQERGITIYSKNASIVYKNTKINIVDTPGHADFGSEVERVLRAVDSVLLVVDAQEGPMPQTRFVLRKSLELGMRPIVVINKIDKPAANPKKAEEDVLMLFMELGANDEQSNFPVVYSNGKAGIAKLNLNDESNDLTPLLDCVLENVRTSEQTKINEELKFQPFNLGYDNYLGRLAIGRIYSGKIRSGQNVYIKKPEGELRKGAISKIFTFKGLKREEVKSVETGDIVMLAGLPDIDIGESVLENEAAKALPAIAVDDPTIVLNFFVNNSPFAGREGKFVTSRQIRERLLREKEVNVGLRVDFSTNDVFNISGRGELHISILLENMRREGYELQVSQPQVILRKENGLTLEPFEEVIIDISQEHQGIVIERLGSRGFVLQNMQVHAASLRLFFEGPTRGLLGFKNQFTVDTRGEGIISRRVTGFQSYKGEIKKRNVGAMISMTKGRALGYALWNLQERGTLYIGPNIEVYEGMVIGNTAKGDDMPVNPTKGKELTNMRSKSSDDAIELTPPFELTIERGLEIMSEDEYLEITPKSVRLRKQYLTENDRNWAKKQYKTKNAIYNTMQR